MTDLNALLQRCCAELPPGYAINIHLARDVGFVEIIDIKECGHIDVVYPVIEGSAVATGGFFAMVEIALEAAQQDEGGNDDDTEDYPATEA